MMPPSVLNPISYHLVAMLKFYVVLFNDKNQFILECPSNSAKLDELCHMYMLCLERVRSDKARKSPVIIPKLYLHIHN